MDLFSELKKMIDESLAKQKPITIDMGKSYEIYGFDPKKPPSDKELGGWVIDLMYKWYTEPKTEMNLPLTGLCIAYNMVTQNKLDALDLVNLKTLVCSIYNMGYNMGKYNMKNPFDPKPQPHTMN